MLARWPEMALILLFAALLCYPGTMQGQDAASSAPPPGVPPTNQEPPPVPKGIEVLARGPVHEAFASPTADPEPTRSVPKRPPGPLDEMPPQEKPEGEVIWISGYWAWDDDRADFIWVSGTWRTPPPGKEWVA